MGTNTLEPKELTQAVSKLVSIGEDMRGHLLTKARDALDGGETNWLAHVSSEARDVEDCIAKLRSIGERLHDILTSTLGFEDGYLDRLEGLGAAVDAAMKDTAAKPRNAPPRRIRTSITQGEINQNLLTLTDARKRGLIRMGEQFRIRLPDGQEFETELVQPGNKLRERGRIREFYEQQRIKPGDHVILEEVSPGTWTLTKGQPLSPQPSSNSMPSSVAMTLTNPTL